MEAFNKGIEVTIIGMALVFLSLGLIMAAIWVMERVFRQREEQEEAPAQAIAENNLSAVSQDSLAADAEVAAAIAVALLAVRGEGELGQTKQLAVASRNGGANMWTAMGRQIHMNSRYIVRETKRQ